MPLLSATDRRAESRTVAGPDYGQSSGTYVVSMTECPFPGSLCDLVAALSAKRRPWIASSPRLAARDAKCSTASHKYTV